MSQTPTIKKSPWIAGLLSVVIPGTGQLYNEEYGKGMLFMLLFFGTFVIWIFGAALSATSLVNSSHHSWNAQMLFFPMSPKLMIVFWIFFVGPAIYFMSLFDAINTANRRNVQFATAGAGAGFTPPQHPPYAQTPPPQPSTAPPSGFTSSTNDPNVKSQEPDMMQTGPQTADAPPKQENGKSSFITGRMIAGFILLFLGAVVVLDKIHIDLVEMLVETLIALVNLWPLIPFGVGMRLLFDYQKLRDKGQLVLGIILTAIGAAFMFELWLGVRVFNAIGDLWPYALLFGGGLLIVSELTKRKKS
ncbi:MAG: hypothetical protein P9L94_12235 [Candidatus Hinthialibacter antarcticus]|nr:hypothetical protein [Candidatus Hinthialibacter antarcticus]